MRPMRLFLVLSLVVGLTAVLTVACGDSKNASSPTAPTAVGDSTVAGSGGSPVSLGAKAPKVDVCHGTGNGSFHLINVNGNALVAHLAHDDGQPGDPVPNVPGKKFDDACNVVDAVTCPCWDEVNRTGNVGDRIC